MKISFKALSVSVLAASLLSIQGCAGLLGQGTSLSTSLNVHAKVVNLTSIASLNSAFGDTATTYIKQIITAQPIRSTTCLNRYQVPGNTTTFLLGTGDTSYAPKAYSLDSESVQYTIIAFGDAPTPQSLLINSGELPGPFTLFIADASVLNPSTYNVFIINEDTFTTTQTTSVSSVDGSRVVPFNITAAGNYRVELRNQTTGTVFAQGRVTIDATHAENIVAFSDAPSSTAFRVTVINGETGCTAP